MLISNKAYFLLGFVYCIFMLAYPCNCETNLPKISRDETEKYTVIFTGFIKKLHFKEKDNYAEFVVETPYKGLVPRDIKVWYDGVSSCKMPFLPNDKWLIYAKMDSVKKKWTVNYCERSRKYPEPDETDDYTIYSGITLDEELKFLELNYTSGQIVGEDTLTKIQEDNMIVIDSRREQHYGTPQEKIILLICSLAAMIIIYFILRRFVK